MKPRILNSLTLKPLTLKLLTLKQTVMELAVMKKNLMKRFNFTHLRGIRNMMLLVLFSGVLHGCSNQDETRTNTVEGAASVASEVLDFNVYKSPTCGCCGDWVDYIQNAGLSVRSHNIDNLTQFKAEKGLKPEYRSCHTAVSKEGYIFEGHIPVEYIQQFLKEQPKNALGLSVPGMPVGSPGMELGGRVDTYQVLKLNLDGSSEVYATVQGNH